MSSDNTLGKDSLQHSNLNPIPSQIMVNPNNIDMSLIQKHLPSQSFTLQNYQHNLSARAQSNEFSCYPPGSTYNTPVPQVLPTSDVRNIYLNNFTNGKPQVGNSQNEIDHMQLNSKINPQNFKFPSHQVDLTLERNLNYGVNPREINSHYKPQPYQHYENENRREGFTYNKSYSERSGSRKSEDHEDKKYKPDWICPLETCRNRNFAKRDSCNICKTEKPVNPEYDTSEFPPKRERKEREPQIERGSDRVHSRRDDDRRDSRRDSKRSDRRDERDYSRDYRRESSHHHSKSNDDREYDKHRERKPEYNVSTSHSQGRERKEYETTEKESSRKEERREYSRFSRNERNDSRERYEHRHSYKKHSKSRSRSREREKKETDRPRTYPPQSQTQQKPELLYSRGEWDCVKCNAHNYSKRVDCYKCHLPKQGNPGVVVNSSQPVRPSFNQDYQKEVGNFRSGFSQPVYPNQEVEKRGFDEKPKSNFSQPPQGNINDITEITKLVSSLNNNYERSNPIDSSQFMHMMGHKYANSNTMGITNNNQAFQGNPKNDHYYRNNNGYHKGNYQGGFHKGENKNNGYFNK